MINFNEKDAQKIQDIILRETNPNDIGRNAVFLSGGLDSAIMLWALRTKLGKNVDIWTYTMDFGLVEGECDNAELVASHFGTAHETIRMENFVDLLRDAQVFLPRAMYNIWPLALVRAAQKDDVDTIFLGEGGDEHFGGYPDPEPRYLQRWAWQIEGVQFTYRNFINGHNMELQMPLHNIPAQELIEYYTPKNKWWLRYAFVDHLPPQVIFQDSTPPTMTHYQRFWQAHVVPHLDDRLKRVAYFSSSSYSTNDPLDPQKCLQRLAHYFWCERHIGYSPIDEKEEAKKGGEGKDAKLDNDHYHAPASGRIRRGNAAAPKRA